MGLKLSDSAARMALPAIGLTLVLSVFVLGLSIGVWVPDVLRPHVWINVGSIVLPNGQELHLLQEWGDDFYRTLIARSGGGRWHSAYTIDGDDAKVWNWHVQLDPDRRQAIISLSRGRLFEYDWVKGELRRAGETNSYSSWSADDLQDALGAPPAP